MTPVNVNLQSLIEQLDAELPKADPVAKVGEAWLRARNLTDLGDQLVDHYVTAARSGGASWSQIGDALGVSKQAAQQRRAGGKYERFTGRARNILVLAQDRARALRHPRVTPEHVLLALLSDREALATKVVAQLAGSVEAVTEAVSSHLEPGTAAPSGHIPFDLECPQILAEQTLAQALDLGHHYIGTQHILLRLLRVPQSRA